MLRIKCVSEQQAVTLRIEGKLLEPWVEAVAQEYATHALHPHAVSLELSGLDFADDAGVRLLRRLIARGARVIACSRFVAELLKTSKETQS